MQIGGTLGHYQILEKLGSGGMGDVYLAHDSRLSRNVALKILLSQVAGDAERLARFEREARAVAALNHPNIVTVYSFEREGTLQFITMECVVGRTLSTVIPPEGLPLDRFFELALPLVDAVSAAHERNIIHRDLKPDNVMVTDAGRLKVLDFGLAKLKPGLADATMATVAVASGAPTIEGQIVGTIAYMSPEQAEGRPLDHRSDIFSLGIILHEMLTGQRPFKGESHASVMASILRDVPPLVSDEKPTVPIRLASVVQRCLAKDPSARYQNARDLWNDLREIDRDAQSASTVGAAPPARRPHVTGAIGAAAGLLTLAVVAYWLWTRDAAPAPEPLGEAAFDQLTHEPGQELFPSLAPDGRTFVYASAAAGNLDIYSQRVGGQNAVNLTADSAADDTQAAFSPDGEMLAFRSERGGGGGVFVMGATGESVRRVADFGYHPAWSPDGRHLLVVTQSVGDPALRFTSSEMWAITVATGERRRLSEGDAAQPSWSPNGHRIAYWGRSAGAGPGDIWTIPASGGTPVAVTTDPSMDWNPVWAPGGRHLYFASDRGGSMNLWRVAVEEASGRPLGRPEAVTTGAGASSRHISISSDGRRIAYVTLIETMNIQQIGFDPAAGVTRGAAEWITRGSRALVQPDASPDGRFLAFNSAGKQEDIFVTRADGGGLQQLTDDAFKDRAARWSPDGKRIAFYSDRTGKYEIWTISPDGSGLQQLTYSPGAHYPVWSPDGRQMAYSTHSPNGAFIFELGKPWSSQTPRALPAIPDRTQTFEIWSWSPDGRWLAGQKHLADLSHAGIAIHEVGTDAIDWLTDFGEWPVWLEDGRRLLFSHQGKLFLVDREARTPRELLSLPQSSLGSVGLSPDNRTIYFTLTAAEADVWLMTLK